MPPTITLAIDSASTVPEGMLTIPPMTIPANDNSQRCINSPAVFSFLSFSFSSIDIASFENCLQVYDLDSEPRPSCCNPLPQLVVSLCFSRLNPLKLIHYGLTVGKRDIFLCSCLFRVYFLHVFMYSNIITDFTACLLS